MMPKTRKFEFLEHTADAYIAAYGEDLADAFKNAALAMFQVMTEVEKVSPTTSYKVDVKAPDEFALLYNWLEELLIRFDTDEILYSKSDALEISKTPNNFRLQAEVWGEKLNRKKHPSKVGVKAITYHLMEIDKRPGRVTIRFLLDI